MIGPASTMPRPTADPEQTRDEPDPACYSLSRELVADDPKCQWEHRAANALDRAGCDQHRKRRRERCDQRAAGKPRHHDEECPLLSEHVAKATGYRRCDGGGQQVGGEYPGHAGRRGVEVVLQGRKRGTTRDCSIA